jgi:hypothetical protein
MDTNTIYFNKDEWMISVLKNVYLRLNGRWT